MSEEDKKEYLSEKGRFVFIFSLCTLDHFRLNSNETMLKRHLQKQTTFVMILVLKLRLIHA